MKTATSFLFILAISGSMVRAAAFNASFRNTKKASSYVPRICRTRLNAGGWGNNQERGVMDEEFGGVNGSPIYDSYEIEDRGKFMQRVTAERKSLRIKKAADLLEVARIAGVELKKKERDPEKLDMFDPEDLTSDDEYLDVSI
eukprot:CAMPEP_0181101092 /NCGR_PEP_ID=MMETSP1071-20121207/13562_1 /TAXON_ID=35127 /ORGANISM="Thalassiosira sp., Strain NH16" /LENGTH=142 /DNA_ID=CAMNT_0023183905 /DNA_START=36 /DNA_END=464 /DNA_ORIENTATION=+